jgi:hypothetical protein
MKITIHGWSANTLPDFVTFTVAGRLAGGSGLSRLPGADAAPCAGAWRA